MNSQILEEIIQLSQQFIRIKSTWDNQKDLNDILELAINQLTGFTIERFNSNKIESAIVHNRKQRPDSFKIILCCHLDVVPGKPNNYEPKIIEDRLYGVGALDMKGNAAAAILAFRDVANELSYPIALQLVTDEEIGGLNGAKHQIEQGIKADFIIATEPTNLNIVNRAKGVLRLIITAYGKTANGAYTWRGDNAIWKMHRFLYELQKLQLFPPLTENNWANSLNLAAINTTNKEFNKIPDECSIKLDIRFVLNDAKNILDAIQNILPSDFTCDVLTNEPPCLTDESNVYIQQLKEIAKSVIEQDIVCYGAQGTSDVRHFTAKGMKGVEFGAMGDGIGTNEEWVHIPSLENYYKILKKFLIKIN